MVIGKIKPFVPVSTLINVYQSFVEPYFDDCSIVCMALIIAALCAWDEMSVYLTSKPSKDWKIALHV